MRYKVTIAPNDLEFSVSEGVTVLEAALNNNISLPHRCQIGACSMCMCKKIAGNIEYQLEPMLTEKEKEAGWIYPCLAIAKSDLHLTFEE